MSDTVRLMVKGARLPKLARSGCSAVPPRTSAIGQKADLRGAMSAFLPVTSASRQGADLQDSVAKGPPLAIRRHSRSRVLSPLVGQLPSLRFMGAFPIPTVVGHQSSLRKITGTTLTRIATSTAAKSSSRTVLPHSLNGGNSLRESFDRF